MATRRIVSNVTSSGGKKLSLLARQVAMTFWHHQFSFLPGDKLYIVIVVLFTYYTARYVMFPFLYDIIVSKMIEKMNTKNSRVYMDTKLSNNIRSSLYLANGL